jgi:hypothetical protein
MTQSLKTAAVAASDRWRCLLFLLLTLPQNITLSSPHRTPDEPDVQTL